MSPAERDLEEAEKLFLDYLEAAPTQAVRLLEEAHAADAAEWLQDVDDELAWRAFNALTTEKQADLLEFADEGLRQRFVERMTPTNLREVVEEMPSDEAVDVLGQADDQVAENVLADITDEETAQELRELSSYEPESAGGVMTTEFVTVGLKDRIGDAVKAVKKEGEDAEENLGVFVVDESGVPVGYLADRALITHSIHDEVKDVMVDPFLISVEEDQEEAAMIIGKYGLASLAVVGDGGKLLGVISADDAANILAEEASEDIHRMVGTSPVQQTRLPIATRVRQRLPLMAVTVAGGLASAKLLAWAIPDAAGEALGGGTAEAILRYLPLIVGLAGNVGVQSSTILVRAFATGEVDQDRDLDVFSSEVTVGSVIGLICGLATMFVAAWMEGAWAIGYAVGAAIAVAVAWAAVLGCLVPMVCRRLSIDPAIVAGPFLICLSDVSGVGIYILVAKSLVAGLN